MTQGRFYIQILGRNLFDQGRGLSTASIPRIRTPLHPGCAIFRTASGVAMVVGVGDGVD
jgi:hypothetical protein